jgi:hypothetical protein
VWEVLNASVRLIRYLFPDVLDVVKRHLRFKSDIIVSIGQVKMVFNELSLVEDVIICSGVVVDPRWLSVVDVVDGGTRAHESASWKVWVLKRIVAPAANRAADLGDMGSTPALTTKVQRSADGRAARQVPQLATAQSV